MDTEQCWLTGASQRARPWRAGQCVPAGTHVPV